jgi:hypothetical protein
MNRSLALCVSLCVLSGCAAMFPSSVPEAATEYKPTGELNFYDKSASFDAWRVRAVNANITKRTDGSWGGVLRDEPLDVSVTPDSLTGAIIKLVREDTADGYIITGQINGAIVRYEVLKDKLLIRTGRQSFTLGRKDANSFGGKGEFTMSGEAANPEVPWPQVGLALLAMFN